MNKKKKREELFYLNKFLALLDIVPLSIEKRESPDFLVKFRESQIGIEVTGYHSGITDAKGRPRREIEEDWTYLQKKIMAEVNQHKELENTSGLIFFKKLKLPNRSEYNNFIGELVKFALDIIQKDINETEPDDIFPLLMKYIKKIFVKKAGCNIAWDWNYNVSSVGLAESELINSVRSKLIANYSDSKFDELWLLIVSGYRLSQAMGIHLVYELNSYRNLKDMLRASCLNRVFIYQYMFDIIYEWPQWVKIKGKNTIN